MPRYYSSLVGAYRWLDHAMIDLPNASPAKSAAVTREFMDASGVDS